MYSGPHEKRIKLYEFWNSTMQSSNAMSSSHGFHNYNCDWNGNLNIQVRNIKMWITMYVLYTNTEFIV